MTDMTVMTDVQPIAGYIGAEITGVDLNLVDESVMASIRVAFYDHQALFFPGQHLSVDALCRFAGYFGEVESLRPGLPHHPNHSKVGLLESKEGGGPGKFNNIWHSDRSFQPCPPAATVVQAVTIPNRGGDTLFASMYAAYECLSTPIRSMLEGMRAVHDRSPALTPYLQDPSMPNGKQRLAHLRAGCEITVQPLVTLHPDSGRKSLFLNRTYTTRILDLSDIESRHLLNLLIEHTEQPCFQMRWRWSAGDVAIWDNRCTTHYAAKDYGKALRVMQRVTVSGARARAPSSIAPSLS